MVAGLDRQVSLFGLPRLQQGWTSDTNNSAEMQLRTVVDPSASYVFSSSNQSTTNQKQVTVYDARDGTPLAKACCGEITTAMCVSNNAKHLITTSDKGCIYFWKMPEPFTQKIQGAKANPRHHNFQVNNFLPANSEEGDFDFNLESN